MCMSNNNTLTIYNNSISNNNDSSNNSDNHQHFHSPIPGFIITNATISLLIFFINGFLIAVFLCKRSVLLKSPSNRLLLSLCLCDFLNGFGSIMWTVRYVRIQFLVKPHICILMLNQANNLL